MRAVLHTNNLIHPSACLAVPAAAPALACAHPYPAPPTLPFRGSPAQQRAKQRRAAVHGQLQRPLSPAQHPTATDAVSAPGRLQQQRQPGSWCCSARSGTAPSSWSGQRWQQRTIQPRCYPHRQQSWRQRREHRCNGSLLCCLAVCGRGGCPGGAEPLHLQMIHDGAPARGLAIDERAGGRLPC